MEEELEKQAAAFEQERKLLKSTLNKNEIRYINLRLDKFS